MDSFLQSPGWEAVQQRMGRKTLRVNGTLLVRHELPFGFFYWYAPRPVLDEAGMAHLAESVARNAGESGALFCRVDPGVAVVAPKNAITRRPVQPAETLVMHLGRTDAELLSAMHPKTRYNIRLAERKGILVSRLGSDPAGLEAFWRLLSDTARRGGFAPHPRVHYGHLLEVRSPEFSNELFVAAMPDGTIAASAIVNRYHGRATYLHGASDYRLRNSMAPHMLHWQVMHAMRTDGVGLYDFWGIDAHRWPGVTRFKEGFGGALESYPQALDIVFRPWQYRCYDWQRRIRGRG